MTERELLDGFESCTLPNTAFRHEDHVHVVWAYLREMAWPAALERFRAALCRFAAHHGKPNLYHETITCAYVLLIHERMQRRPSPTWDDFRRDNPDLLSWKPSILARYYRPETLRSDLARRSFLFPDAVTGDTHHPQM
ncbi:MAG TPA: hypothetical protein VJ853_10190 [Thermoanaerobaculia bacterium]|nr:hypothetical protein [Thermoanaerobaculia bacterium]